MDFNLSDSQKAIQARARRFALERIRPKIEVLDSQDRFPGEIRDGLRAEQFWGLPFPEQYGGSGEGYLSYLLAIEQLSKEAAAVGATLSVHTMAAATIFHYGNELQKKAYLPALLSGDAIGSFSFTEAATGSDPGAIVTQATKSDGHYVLDGRKMFSSNSTLDGVAIVFAKDVEKGNEISAFVVPKNSRGFEVEAPVKKMGLGGFETAPYTLNSVAVPSENVVGGEACRGKGFQILLDMISVGKLGIAAQSLGMAERALDESVKYAGERRQLNKPLRMFPTIQALVAEMATEIEASRWLVYNAGFIKDRGEGIALEAAMAKLFCAQSAKRVIDKAMSVHGCYGYIKDRTVERLYRDVKLGELYEGTEEIQKILIASKVLWPRFSSKKIQEPARTLSQSAASIDQ